MDLREQLERAIGDGPPLPPPTERLARGRAAVRRRRLAVGAGVLAVATALVAPFAVGGGGGIRGVDPAPPASRPTTPPDVPPDLEAGRLVTEPEHGPSYTARTYPWRGDTVAAIDFDGDEPFVRPGATVLERRADLYPGSGVHSVALVVRYEGRRYWVAMDWTERGGAIGQNRAGEGFATFDAFVADFTSVGPTTQGPPVGTDSVEPGLEVEVVDGAPQLPSEMPGSLVIGPVVRGDERAYGEEVTLDGERTFVLVLRGPDGGWRVHRVHTAERGDDLVTWLRAAGWRPTGEEAS